MNAMRGLCLLLVAFLTGACVGVAPAATPVTPIPTTATTPPSLSPTAPIPTSPPTAISTPTATALPPATAEPAATATPTPALQPSTTPDPSAPPPKAVFIVGPEEHLTEGNLAEAEAMALEAE